MIFGYARVSSKDQLLATQLKELTDFGVDEIISEKISGVSTNRQKLDELLMNLKVGDTLVITRMDRLGRNTLQLLELIEELEERNINLVILNMGIDTRTAVGKFFVTVMAAFSELERTTNKEKQKAGIQLAKKKGLYKGRPEKYSLESPKVQHAINLRLNSNKTVKEISQITSISESTLYRKFKEYSEIKGSIYV